MGMGELGTGGVFVFSCATPIVVDAVCFCLFDLPVLFLQSLAVSDNNNNNFSAQYFTNKNVYVHTST